MNSAALATTTHRKMEGVFDGTSTQVRVQIINKCKAMMASRGLYKKGNLLEERDGKKERRTEEQKNNWRLRARTNKHPSHLLGLTIYGH